MYQLIPVAIFKTVHILDDFKPVAVQNLQNAGYVHSDVRMANIVFTDNGGKLIDFDLTNKIGVLYPNGYVTFAEHHSQAKKPDVDR